MKNTAAFDLIFFVFIFKSTVAASTLLLPHPCSIRVCQPLQQRAPHGMPQSGIFLPTTNAAGARTGTAAAAASWLQERVLGEEFCQ